MRPCHTWTGARDSGGYGHVWVDGVCWQVHRLEWTKHFGDIPEGKLILHQCDNPPCYEITHLFLGDYSMNMLDAIQKGRRRRGWGASLTNLRKTVCKNGHPFSSENTYIRPNGYRDCETCKEATRQRYRDRMRKAWESVIIVRRRVA